MPIAGTVRNLRITLRTAPGAGKSRTFTLRKNAADQSVTVTISDANTTAVDTTNSFTYAAGDLLSVKSVPTSTPAASIVDWSIESEGTNAKEFFTASSPGTASASATNYTQIIDSGEWSATYANRSNIIPGTFTLKTIYANLVTAPGAAKTWTFQMYKNGAAEASSSFAITGAGTTTGNVTGLSIAYAAADTIAFQSVPTGTPTTSKMRFGFGWSANTDGESIIGGNANVNALSNSATNYVAVSAAFTAPTATEANVKSLSGPTSWVFKNFRVVLSGAPAAGKSYAFTLRKNTANGNSTITIADAATSGTDGTNTDTIADTNVIDISSVPTGTPTAQSAKWTAIQYIAPPTSSRLLPLLGVGT